MPREERSPIGDRASTGPCLGGAQPDRCSGEPDSVVGVAQVGHERVRSRHLTAVDPARPRARGSVISRSSPLVDTGGAELWAWAAAQS